MDCADDSLFPNQAGMYIEKKYDLIVFNVKYKQALIVMLLGQGMSFLLMSYQGEMDKN